MIRKRAAVKNRIRDQAYRLGFVFMYYRKKNLDLLRKESHVLNILVGDLNNLDQQIFEMDMQISNSIQNNEYAKIIDTIPRLGNYCNRWLNIVHFRQSKSDPDPDLILIHSFKRKPLVIILARGAENGGECIFISLWMQMFRR